MLQLRLARLFLLLASISSDQESATLHLTAAKQAILTATTACKGLPETPPPELLNLFDAAASHQLDDGERYGTIWHDRTDDLTLIVHACATDQHLRQARCRAEEGFLPVAIAVGNVRDQASKRELRVASVWRKAMPSRESLDEAASRQANAIIAAFRLGHESPLVQVPRRTDPTDLRLPYLVMERLIESGASPEQLAELLLRNATVGDRNAEREYYLLGALGNAGPDVLTTNIRSQVIQRAEQNADSSDPGVRAMRRWLLQQWAAAAEEVADGNAVSPSLPAAATEQPARRQLGDSLAWHTNSTGLAFVVIPSPGVIRIGSEPYDPQSSPGKPAWEAPHFRKVRHAYLIGAHEVTVAEYQKFDPTFRPISSVSSPKQPIVWVTWHDCMRFCNWLSKQEGLMPCFPEPGENDRQAPTRLPEDFLERDGYRLPTDAEWEWAARAGTRTRRFFGDSEELLERFAFRQGRLPQATGRLKPNRWGLFDVYGNAAEWCMDRAREQFPRHLGRFGVDEAAYVQSPKMRMVVANDGRILRGGSVGESEGKLRSAERIFLAPGATTPRIGFRLARTIVSEPP